jgi:hypothetical protein
MIVMLLWLKYQMLCKLRVAIERSDAFNNILGIHSYGFASDLNVLAMEARTGR